MQYAIFEGNMERLEKKLNRIRRKCNQYGCDFKYEQVGEEFREIENPEGKKITTRFVIVDVEGIAKVNGWKNVHVREHWAVTNILLKYPLDFSRTTHRKRGLKKLLFMKSLILAMAA